MVARRQRPNTVQVIRQQHESVNRKGWSLVRLAKKFPPPKSHDSEKISAAGSFRAPILHDEDSPK
jgi:hypothetical protein